jgi:amino acid transporter
MGSMLSTPRVAYSLARDGYLPAWFGRVHSRFRTPAASIAFYGLVCFLLAAYGSFVWLAGLSVLTRVLIYLACIGGLPRLERRFGGGAESLALPGGRLIPAVAILVCLGLLTQVKLFDVSVTALFLGVGTALYFFAREAQRRTARAH